MEKASEVNVRTNASNLTVLVSMAANYQTYGISNSKRNKFDTYRGSPPIAMPRQPRRNPHMRPTLAQAKRHQGHSAMRQLAGTVTCVFRTDQRPPSDSLKRKRDTLGTYYWQPLPQCSLPAAKCT